MVIAEKPKVIVHNNKFYFKHNNEMFVGIMYDELISFTELKISKQYKQTIFFKEYTRTKLISDQCLKQMRINKYREGTYNIDVIKNYCIRYLDKFYFIHDQHAKYI